MSWKLYEGDCLEIMATLPNESIDMTITSPPYDNLRDYEGYTFNFEGIAHELYRLTKPGGVVVWVVGDATINGSETGTSFRQALYFKDEVGFNLHDTMIYEKTNPYPANIRYQQNFEYMFVFSKNKPKTFNPLSERKSEKEIKKILKGQCNFESSTYRNKFGETKKLDKAGLERVSNSWKNLMKIKSNIWKINAGYMISSKDKIAFNHPAIFPEQLAHDHIISWSNPDDLILDPMAGSGTVLKVAESLGRNSVGIEISKEYCEIIRKRMSDRQQTIFEVQKQWNNQI